MDEMNRKTTKLQKSKNVTVIEKFRQVIRKQKTMKEYTQYTFPTFLKSILMRIIWKLILVTLKE